MWDSPGPEVHKAPKLGFQQEARLRRRRASWNPASGYGPQTQTECAICFDMLLIYWLVNPLLLVYVYSLMLYICVYIYIYIYIYIYKVLYAHDVVILFED